jgi:hypothetical protein
MLRRYRLVFLAVLASLAVHAVVMVGMPHRLAAVDSRTDAIYSATLEALATPAVLAPPPAAGAPSAPAPRPAARPRARPRVAAAKAVDAVPADDASPALDAPAPLDALALGELSRIEALQPLPDRLALAAPTTAAAAAAEEKFPVEAMPANLTIEYALNSAFADGQATYRWSRDGDSYRITGEAQAEGFFALFLEGQILQESHGTVTERGLQPERFSERKPGSPPEGLEFDWRASQVTFDRNGSRKTDKLEANTVDWLSMIFQLAHRPPSGEAMDLRVFTQRKMYAFHLQIVGT